MKHEQKPEDAPIISSSQLSRLRQTPARAAPKGTPVKETFAPARSAKQMRKDNLRLALAAIKHKVPKEGRGIF
jgi:hypothetical protein